MAAKTPPSAYIALVASLCLCLAMGPLWYATDKSVQETLGQGENPDPANLAALQQEEKSLQADIAKAAADLDARRQELDRADLDLVRHRTSYANQQLISATATTTKTSENILGQETKLKLSPWKMVADRGAGHKANVDAQAAAAKADENNRFEKIDEAVRKRQEDLQGVLREITDQNTRFTADQELLNKKKEDLEKEKDQVERVARDDFGKRATRINQLEDQIRQLLELDLKFVTEILPCGNVLEVNERGDRVIINLSSKDRIVPGMLFMVFSYDQGRFNEKGMLEVIRVTGSLSECRVTGLIDPKRAPVARNDKIGNPVYNPAKPPVFVFAGEFGEYNREDLAQFVRATGGTVVDRLQPGVDFLVVRGDANDRSDKERALAREYQILALTERQLLRFVRPAFAPK